MAREWAQAHSEYESLHLMKGPPEIKKLWQPEFIYLQQTSLRATLETVQRTHSAPERQCPDAQDADVAHAVPAFSSQAHDKRPAASTIDSALRVLDDIARAEKHYTPRHLDVQTRECLTALALECKRLQAVTASQTQALSRLKDDVAQGHLHGTELSDRVHALESMGIEKVSSDTRAVTRHGACRVTGIEVYPGLPERRQAALPPLGDDDSAQCKPQQEPVHARPSNAEHKERSPEQGAPDDEGKDAVSNAELEIDNSYTLNGSMWDASILVGTSAVAPAGSFFSFLLLLLNVLVQSIFVWLVLSTLTDPNFDNETVRRLRDWRHVLSFRVVIESRPPFSVVHLIACGGTCSMRLCRTMREYEGLPLHCTAHIRVF